MTLRALNDEWNEYSSEVRYMKTKKKIKKVSKKDMKDIKGGGIRGERTGASGAAARRDGAGYKNPDQ
jgi:hypothetical protein